jgi:UDP-N-acetylglucosamine acyltransferase
VSIHLGTVQGGGLTQIGDGNLLMGYVHVGHDCVIGNQNILANYAGLAGHVRIDDYANFGGMVGINQFTHIGSYAYVTGQSGLEKDLPPYCVASGSRPTIIRGANIVGLRRRGFSAESISKINEAIKLWTRSNIEREICIREIEAQFGDVPEIRTFLEFIKGSKNGVVK